MKALSLVAVCTLFLLGGATAARADVITFAFENVIFADTTSATGTLNDAEDWAAVLEMMMPRLDSKLDEIATARRPEGIPVNWIRQNLNSKAMGCYCNTLLIAMQREPK